MFSLSSLLDCDEIVIQCHDIPDADTIASAFAVHTYLKENKKNSKIIYSGMAEISKANLLEMIVELAIPIEYTTEMPRIGTLVLVDCQYGERNVQQFEADTVIVIDHHTESKGGGSFGIIRSQLGSCSTLIWDLLNKTQFDVNKHPSVSTALYYGLYTDTNNLEEIAHPLDKDARDSLKFDNNIINKLRNNNLSLSELSIAGTALTQYKIDTNLKYAIFKAAPCDPNILGFISDLALQVNDIDVCLVYNELNDGFKLSIRSCIREVMANEFSVYLTEGVGSGGGHIGKAGGFINKTKIEEQNTDIGSFLEKRAREYFSSYEVVDSADHSLDINCMQEYRKRNIPVGFVASTDIFSEGEPVLIRTLEGDTEIEASKDILFMIGILGEVYPITTEKWGRNYALTDCAFEADYDYSPTAKNKVTGDSVEIAPFAKPCLATGEVHIFAAPVTKNTKVFTSWNVTGYMFGAPGDYIAVRSDDHNDVYIIRRDIFEKTYERL